MSKGKVICVGGKKGGTGKSTLCVNLAGSYAAEGLDVLLLDCDDNQSSSKFFSRRKKHQELILSGDTETLKNPVIKKHIRVTGKGGEFNYIECATKNAEDNLTQDIAKLREKYDVIIIDTGGYKNNAFKSSIASADVTYIPVMPSQLDIEQLPAIFDLIQHLESSISIAIRDDDFKLDVRVILNGVVKSQQLEITDAKEALQSCNHVVSLSSVQIPHAKIFKDLMKASMFLDDIRDQKRAVFELLRQEIEGKRRLHVVKKGLNLNNEEAA